MDCHRIGRHEYRYDTLSILSMTEATTPRRTRDSSPRAGIPPHEDGESPFRRPLGRPISGARDRASVDPERRQGTMPQTPSSRASTPLRRLALPRLALHRLTLRRLAPLLIALLVVSTGCTPSEAPAVDLVLVGGTVHVGDGSEPFVADVAVGDGRIVAVGEVEGPAGAERIDVSGLVVAPGFIDAHSHAELDEEWGRDARHFLTQGITTVSLGLDGGGPWRVAERLRRWDENGIGVNALTFVGHNAIRREVMGMDARPPTDEELERMKAMVHQGMEEGAFGLSTGLFYTPGYYATTEEVIELARVAAAWEGAIYDTHDRDLGATYQGIGYDASVLEGIRIGEESGLRVIFSH
ncbi:MAG TPA: hypothetical protein ENO23_04575, partial [Alphaproteobacteria bacterium]|nr:hypothetical protein [Alphaproteobacteria bacterium]